jgi:transposase
VGHHTEAFVGIDTSKLRNAVAIAESGRGGEVRYLGEFRKLAISITSSLRKSNRDQHLAASSRTTI